MLRSKDFTDMQKFNQMLMKKSQYSKYSEDSLIEPPTFELFRELGWDTVNCFHERFDAHGKLWRETTNEVVLPSLHS